MPSLHAVSVLYDPHDQGRRSGCTFHADRMTKGLSFQVVSRALIKIETLQNVSLPDLMISTRSAMTDLKGNQEGPSSILTALHGQSVVLRDLNAILDGWPREVNQDVDRLRHDVDEWLGRYVFVSKLEKASYRYIDILYHQYIKS